MMHHKPPVVRIEDLHRLANDPFVDSPTTKVI
jgi:hypothetical protein